MVSAIIETTVLVDLLRDHPPSITWFQRHALPELGITPIIWMEVIAGGQTKARRLRAARLLKELEMIYLTQIDLDWAMEQQMLFELSHGVGMMDCLIASVCHRLQVPLYTHNLKHFAPLLGELAYKPYL